MSEAINGAIDGQQLEATLEAQTLEGALDGGAGMGAALETSGLVMNDYRLTLRQTQNGHLLTVDRGAEKQEMEVRNGRDGVGITNISISEAV